MLASVISLDRARPRHAAEPELLGGLKAMHDVAEKLQRNGFVVVGAFYSTRPELTVQRHYLIGQMVEEGLAGYYFQSQTERRGEFFGEGNDGTKVRIIWTEKVTP